MKHEITPKEERFLKEYFNLCRAHGLFIHSNSGAFVREASPDDIKEHEQLLRAKIDLWGTAKF